MYIISTAERRIAGQKQKKLNCKGMHLIDLLLRDVVEIIVLWQLACAASISWFGVCHVPILVFTASCHLPHLPPAHPSIWSLCRGMFCYIFRLLALFFRSSAPCGPSKSMASSAGALPDSSIERLFRPRLASMSLVDPPPRSTFFSASFMSPMAFFNLSAAALSCLAREAAVACTSATCVSRSSRSSEQRSDQARSDEIICGTEPGDRSRKGATFVTCTRCLAGSSLASRRPAYIAVVTRLSSCWAEASRSDCCRRSYVRLARSLASDSRLSWRSLSVWASLRAGRLPLPLPDR